MRKKILMLSICYLVASNVTSVRVRDAIDETCTFFENLFTFYDVGNELLVWFQKLTPTGTNVRNYFSHLLVK